MSSLITARVVFLGFFVLALSLFPSTGFSDRYRFLENGTPLLKGEDSGYLTETPTRTRIDLSGDWSYEIDGGPSGTVRVPSAYDFVGTVTFRRKLTITADQIDRYDFHFAMMGSNYNTEVTINGEFITNHAGGYTSFVVPVPRNVLQVGSENIIQVITNNRLDARKTIPLRPLVWSWRNYGGILRDIFLLATPSLAISEVRVSSRLEADFGRARIGVVAGFEGIDPLVEQSPGDGKKGTLGFSFEMVDKITGETVGKSAVVPLVRQGEEWTRAGTEVLLESPKLWSPETPDLYLLRCTITSMVSAGKDKDVRVVDQYEMTFGVRDLSVAGGNLMVNGKRLVLRGVIWNEDHPTWGGAMTAEDLERDIVLIKNLGANAIRFGGRPPHPYMLNLCDRYGVMALEELPLSNVPTAVLMQEEYLEAAAGMMREMIVRDRNHPSVLAWGIGDGFESSDETVRPAIEHLVRTARSLDDRPTWYGSRLRLTDVCTDLVDLAVVTIGAGDQKAFRVQLQEWKTRHPGQPVIVGRFGTEVQPGNRNGYSDPLSYEYQARFYIQRAEIIRSLDYDGVFVWAFNDWRGDRPALTVNSGDPWMHTMGLVSERREKRLAYEAVRSIFRSEKFVALPIGSYAPSAPIVYVLAGLVVLIGVVYLYNASRRFRECLNRSLMNSYNFFADVRDQRVVSVIHSTLLGLIVSVATAIVVSSILFHFRQSWVLDNMLSYLLVSDVVKEAVVSLIWNPLRSILTLAGVFFVLLLLAAGVMLLLSPLFKSRIYPFHAYAITMWSTPPLLGLVPLGMILFRLMESSVYVIPSLVIVAVLLFWVFLRLLKGISIIFDALTAKVYAIGLLSMVGVLAVAYLYYDYTQSTSTYLSFLYRMMAGSQ